MPLIVAL